MIPEWSQSGIQSPARIDRHRVALVRRSVMLSEGANRWGRVIITVADWPSWDPLPPRIEVYRRLVLGEPESRPVASEPRPVLAAYRRDAEPRDEGPPLPAPLKEKLRRADAPVRVHLPYRGEELWAKCVRPPTVPARGGARTPSLGRFLTAALLIPGAVLLYGLVGILLLWRFAAAPHLPAGRVLPRFARTFRGRLVTLFAAGVMLPLFAVTFFLRSTILAHSGRDTADHARNALETARRVLDDYLPSAPAGTGIRVLDDVLIAWLAGSVGYDLSVYAPDSTLVATSRRDLYAAGIVPDRVPGNAYVTIGLAGGDQYAGSRTVTGGSFEEITTALAAIPGVPGVRSPGLLSLLLLPQRRVAEAGPRSDGGRLRVQPPRLRHQRRDRGTRRAPGVAAGGGSSRGPARSPAEISRRAWKSLRRGAQGAGPRVPLDVEQPQVADRGAAREERGSATLLALNRGVVALPEDGPVLSPPPRRRWEAAAPAPRRSGRSSPGSGCRRAGSCATRARRAVEVEPRPGELARVVTARCRWAAGARGWRCSEGVSDLVLAPAPPWAEMAARMIAHEIKNPLTPIRGRRAPARVWRRGPQLRPGAGGVRVDRAHEADRRVARRPRSSPATRGFPPEIRPVDVAPARGIGRRRQERRA